MRYTRLLVVGVLVLLIVAGWFSYAKRWNSTREAEALLSRPLPPPTIPTAASGAHSPSINLPVPFTVQAPDGNWDMPYQEACEEAAVLMAIRYVFSNPILDVADADKAILDLVRTNAEKLKYPVDQTAKQLMDLIHAIDPKIPVALVENPSVELLKRELAIGNVIIVPTVGRKLQNPFYRQPGPIYHILVLRGYTADGYFITNDPGTKRGEEYLYPFERVMDAMGDWNGGDPANGEKVVLILQKMDDS